MPARPRAALPARRPRLRTAAPPLQMLRAQRACCGPAGCESGRRSGHCLADSLPAPWRWPPPAPATSCSPQLGATTSLACSRRVPSRRDSPATGRRSPSRRRCPLRPQ
eukprot:12408636-Alexandrium_andersonii.AAC.1